MRLSLRTASAAILAVALAGCGGIDDDPILYRDFSGDDSALSNAVCPGSATVEGVDVSTYQGTVNWTAVKNSGRHFGIARVSDGINHVDAHFDANWAGMKSAGLIRGVYQFFRPEQDPIAQADLLLKHVPSLGAGDLPPVLDVEVVDSVATSKLVANASAWLAHVKARLGRKPIVYTSPSFWNALRTSSLGADLWVANWKVTCPSLPTAWSAFRFWQYSATGSVAGIAGQVDLDRFNGSLTQLRALAGE